MSMTSGYDGTEGTSRRDGKSATAFRTISEVAEQLDVPPHVLRFWETKFSQIKPLKRGGGRRYYRPEDIELLRRIRELLYREGYTIKGVQKLLKEVGAKGLENVERVAGTAQAGSPPKRLNEKQRGEITDMLDDLTKLKGKLDRALKRV